MSAHRHQQGLTFIGFLIVAIMVGFFAFVALRLFPIYSEKFAVIQSMKSVANLPNIGAASPTQIQNDLMKNFVIQGIDEKFINTLKDELTIDKDEDGNRTMTLEYEIRNNFYGELDLALNFSYTVILPVKE
ncbi:MAG TPA: DUF4845 domain-containing protein [Gammaproteobacteria bacterium]|nr:DUF4845 domain-containing protein [Gammaproteobacteria bacterium]